MSWTAMVPAATPVGTWTARVACVRAGSAVSSFSVKAPAPAPTPSTVVVRKSGASIRLTCKYCDHVSWGVVLENVSPDEDALDVWLALNFRYGSSGPIQYYGSAGPYDIPAGATYYAGGHFDYTGSTFFPTWIQVASVQVGAYQAKAIGDLPPVTNVRITGKGVVGEAHVTGEFTNPYARTISSQAAVTVVAFDERGNVFGGGSGNPTAPVPPDGHAEFDVPIVSLGQTQVASAQVTVAPKFGAEKAAAQLATDPRRRGS